MYHSLISRIIFTRLARAPSTVLSLTCSQDLGVEREISFPRPFSSHMDSVVETQRLLGCWGKFKRCLVLSLNRGERRQDGITSAPLPSDSGATNHTYVMVWVPLFWTGMTATLILLKFGGVQSFIFIVSHCTCRHHQRKRRNARRSSLLSALSLKTEQHMVYVNGHT